MTPKTKKRIDAMDYEEMLTMRRFSAMGHPYFIGEVGTYFAEQMAERRDDLEPGEHVVISKRIGWR